VLAGIGLATPLGTIAGLYLWLCVPLSVAGLGLTLRSLEARTGRLSLGAFRGLHSQTPTLAALFLVTGLATVGFPGTLGFFGTEMLTDSAAQVNKALGLLVVLSAALSGIAVVRAYAMLFLGAQHHATVDLRIRGVELAALLTLVALLVGGTLWPQPGLDSRREAADALARGRAATRRVPEPGSFLVDHERHARETEAITRVVNPRAGRRGRGRARAAVPGASGR
jgi:NADH-quinone oxidoreductase subunit M